MKNVVICLFGSSIMEGRSGVADPQDRWYNVCQRLMSDHPTRYVLPEDGIHMNKAGHEVFARNMFELMDSLLRKRR